MSDHDAQLGHLVSIWGHLGVVMSVLAGMPDEQALAVIGAAAMRVKTLRPEDLGESVDAPVGSTDAQMADSKHAAEIARLRAENERLLKDAKAHAKRARNANRKARTEQENAARLAAERDELREVVRRAADGQETGDVIADPKFWGRLYSDAINGWRDTSRAVLTKIAEGGTPADVVEVIGEFIDEYVASDDDTAALFNRAKTKAES